MPDLGTSRTILPFRSQEHKAPSKSAGFLLTRIPIANRCVARLVLAGIAPDQPLNRVFNTVRLRRQDYPILNLVPFVPEYREILRSGPPCGRIPVALIGAYAAIPRGRNRKRKAREQGAYPPQQGNCTDLPPRIVIPPLRPSSARYNPRLWRFSRRRHLDEHSDIGRKSTAHSAILPASRLVNYASLIRPTLSEGPRIMHL